MSMTLGTVLETGVTVRAAGIPNVPVDKVTAKNGATEGAVTENETDNKENGTATDKVEAEEAGKEETTPQETPEETPEATVPENTTPQETPEGTAPEITEPEAGTPEETPEQPEVEKEVTEEKAAEENTGEKWWSKVEAESGTMAGTAQPETPTNLDGKTTLVGYLDKGESKASFTVSVDVPFEGEAQMKVRYRSGDDRDLCYRVNNGDVKKWEGLNSGNWTTLKETEEQTIQLQKGTNTVKFFASNGKDGPGIDYITFSMNGGTEEDMQGKEEMIVKFKVGENTVKTLNKKMNETITADEVPSPEVPEGKDFLGWFWGPGSTGTKYEGIFPMNLSELPNDVRNKLNGEMTLTARFGKHTLANPKEKAGYRLIFDEEFNGTSLDETNWVDRYLSSWSTTYYETQGRSFDPENGIMSLQITEETQPWCKEFDGETVISGFTTGQRNGLHNWNQNSGKPNQIRNPEDTQLTHINQYGYYEMRMKGQSGSSRHSAWWLLGFEDVPEESAEIDIFEVKGQNDHGVPPALHGWKDADAFESEGLKEYTNNSKDFNNEYHVYGFDWQQGTSGNAQYPDKIVLYIDGEQVGEKNVNIDYPMIQLLSLYEKRAGGWTGAWEWEPYPNTMDVDYVRVYKKLPSEAVAQDNLQITGIEAEDLKIREDKIELEQYENGYKEKNLPGTKSYVRVKWNDGVETQEPVVWEPITDEDIAQLKVGKSIEKKGTVKVNSIPGKPFEASTTMTVTPEEAPLPPPYSVEGATVLKDTGYLFDGKIHEKDAQSAEFSTKKEDMASGKVAITYDFQKEVKLSGIDMWTNFGAKQGITSFNLATWDKDAKDWKVLNDGDGQAQLFTLNWQTNEEGQEEQSVSIEPIKTSKVKIIVKDAGLEWKKFAMREIQFDTEDVEVVLDSLTVTPPTKTEYLKGEELNLEGMTVTGHYSDGTTAEIPLEDVIITGYDSSKVGKQTITVTHKSNDKLTATFEVEVKKGLAGVNKVPSIEAKDVVLTVGAKFDPLKGVKASDAEDGDLTKDIEVEENTVNTAKVGVYKVVYKVTDKDGAVARKTIKVTVKAKDTGKDNGKDNGKDTGKDTGKTTNKSVKTADTMELGLWGMLILLSGSVVTVLFRKRTKR